MSLDLILCSLHFASSSRSHHLTKLHLRILRHAQSWDEVHRFCDARLKVWSIKPSQVILPTLLPWIEETLDGMSYMRSDTEEGTVLWCNLPTAGVVSTLKKEYFLQLITGLMASKPVNTVCIVLHANRAGEGKKKSDPYRVESCQRKNDNSNFFEPPLTHMIRLHKLVHDRHGSPHATEADQG